jgi:4'-phosphopantetheinyl transferase
MLKVYLKNIAPLRDEAVFEEKMKLVRAERQEKIRAFRAVDDRCRGLAAGLALREALEQEGISYRDASFSYGASGKPYLCGRELCFSLSHAGELAVCVLSDCEVGADIEQLSRFDGREAQMERIARKVMTEEERQLWQKNPSGEALVRLWTKKESYAKHIGAGLSCDFATIDTIRGASYAHPAVPEGYFLSVCTELL